jgi:D-aspartate ligase
VLSEVNGKIRSNYSSLIGVVVTAGLTGNSLGVIRAFGGRGIPVVYIDSERGTMVRYSKYITKRITCQSTRESETEFINVLLDFGKQINGQMMIIPTGDRDVLALSKHKRELEQFYRLPVPTFETVQKLVNKRNFYKLLAEMQIPHPKTYFPESLIELQLMRREVAYPFIIKPAYSLPFQEEFGRKNFVINSPQELDLAVGRLRGKNLEVLVQEIIPGKEIYTFYTYLNRKSEPLAVCGYDKIRQYPLDFGSGSFCKSNWRSSVVEECIRLLQAIGYHGFAEPELKKDPRDGKYKVLEINARTTLQNRLASACGVDVEYVAFLDAAGRCVKKSLPFRRDIFWVDDFVDLLSCLMLLKRKELRIGEMIKSLKARKVHSVAAWDDPAPLFVHAMNLCFSALRR